MRRLKYERGRMIFEDPLPQSLSGYLRYTGKSYSMPICKDILKRVISAYPNIEVDSAITKKLHEDYEMNKDLSCDYRNTSPIDEFPGLYPHQRSGIRWLVRRKKGILADKQGSGKTVTSLVAASLSGGSLLIVCSIAKEKDWASHADKWYSGEYQITTYKSASKYSDYDTLIMDEAHKIRNRKTSSYKEFKKICGKCKNVYMLTGTPNVNNVDDIWTLLSFCDPKKFGSYWGFVHRFCNIKLFSYGIEVGGLLKSEEVNWKNLIYGRYLISRSVKLCFNELRETVHLKMTKAHEDEYREATPQTIRMQDVKTLVNLAIQPNNESELGKYSIFIDHRDKFIDRRPLIFVKHIAVAEHITDILEGMGITVNCIHSKKSKKTNDLIVEKFQSDKLDVLCLTYGIGGEGLNLTKADTIIYFEYPWTYASMSQADARMLRLGQKNKDLRVYSFVMKGTIEEHILEIISSKKDVTLENIRLTHESFNDNI